MRPATPVHHNAHVPLQSSTHSTHVAVFLTAQTHRRFALAQIHHHNPLVHSQKSTAASSILRAALPEVRRRLGRCRRRGGVWGRCFSCAFEGGIEDVRQLLGPRRGVPLHSRRRRSGGRPGVAAAEGGANEAAAAGDWFVGTTDSMETVLKVWNHHFF